MIKQLIINDKKSYDDFNVYIASRNITSPKKKIIKESVPFSNIVYDFSKMNGELYWEQRTLQYTFDIAELSTENMEVEKSKLLNWLLNVHDTDIYDPYIGDYHFHGSYDSDSWSEDFGAGTITVTFSVYPYKISNSDSNVIEDITNVNLYNFEDQNTVDKGVTVDNEGWITFTYDNSEGTNTKYLNYWTNNLDLDTSKQYTLVVEVKNVSGAGSLYVVSENENSQFDGSSRIIFSEESSNLVKIFSVTTKDSFDNSSVGLRTYTDFRTGEVGSITFRLSVLENTSITEDEFVYSSFGNASRNITINNNSSHRIMPKITSTGNMTIILNNQSYSIGEGTYNNTFYLAEGENNLTITGYGEITFSYAEEVF